MNSGLGKGMFLTVGAIAQAVAGFAVQIVLMRQLVPEDFGHFALVLAGCSLVQTILSWRLNVLIIRLPPGDLHSAAARLYQVALVWETFAAALCTLIWLALADLLTAYALLLVLALVLGQWGNQAIAFYERDMAYGRITAVETGSQIFGHMVALTLVLGGAGAFALYARELAAIVARIGAFAKIGALPGPKWEWPSRRQLFDLWRASRSIWLEGVLEGTFARLVILTVGTLTNLRDAGIFAQSQRLAILPHQFMAPVVSRYAINLFNRAEHAQARRALLLRLGTLTTATLIPAIAVTLLWSEELVPWVFGQHWSETGHTLKSMIGVILFLPLFDLFRSYCYALGRVSHIVVARLTQISSFLILIWWISESSGTQVAVLAWALSCAFTAGFAVLLFGSIQRTEQP